MYSHKTQKAYLGHVTRFHSYIGKDLDYLNVLDIRIDVIKIPRPKKESKLPKVIGENTVIKILKVLENEKHKTILFLVYSAGLRVGEVVRLRAKDIDSERMLIKVTQSKGRKDRYTILSEVALN